MSGCSLTVRHNTLLTCFTSRTSVPVPSTDIHVLFLRWYTTNDQRTGNLTVPILLLDGCMDRVMLVALRPSLAAMLHRLDLTSTATVNDWLVNANVLRSIILHQGCYTFVSRFHLYFGKADFYITVKSFNFDKLFCLICWHLFIYSWFSMAFHYLHCFVLYTSHENFA